MLASKEVLDFIVAMLLKRDKLIMLYLFLIEDLSLSKNLDLITIVGL
jgi:hypothetical protein